MLGLLFCHIKFMFLPSHQDYYPLFFLLLKNLHISRLTFFQHYPAYPGLLTHIPHCLSAHTYKHQQLLYSSPLGSAGSTLPPHQRELAIALLRNNQQWELQLLQKNETQRHQYIWKSQTIHTLFLNTLPFPLMGYFPDFTAFGLRETFEYHLAQWSSPEIISNNAYLDHFVTLKEQQFKSYNFFWKFYPCC